MTQAPLEKSVEAMLRRRVQAECPKAKCLKFVSPGFTGVPDRVILLPGGRVVFVELKRPGQTERQRQLFVQATLRRLGFVVFSSVATSSDVELVVEYCRRVYTEGVGNG